MGLPTVGPCNGDWVRLGDCVDANCKAQWSRAITRVERYFTDKSTQSFLLRFIGSTVMAHFNGTTRKVYRPQYNGSLRDRPYGNSSGMRRSTCVLPNLFYTEEINPAAASQSVADLTHGPCWIAPGTPTAGIFVSSDVKDHQPSR